MHDQRHERTRTSGGSGRMNKHKNSTRQRRTTSSRTREKKLEKRNNHLRLRPASRELMCSCWSDKGVAVGGWLSNWVDRSLRGFKHLRFLVNLRESWWVAPAFKTNFSRARRIVWKNIFFHSDFRISKSPIQRRRDKSFNCQQKTSRMAMMITRNAGRKFFNTFRSLSIWIQKFSRKFQFHCRLLLNSEHWQNEREKSPFWKGIFHRKKSELESNGSNYIQHNEKSCRLSHSLSIETWDGIQIFSYNNKKMSPHWKKKSKVK